MHFESAWSEISRNIHAKICYSCYSLNTMRMRMKIISDDRVELYGHWSIRFPQICVYVHRNCLKLWVYVCQLVDDSRCSSSRLSIDRHKLTILYNFNRRKFEKKKQINKYQVFAWTLNTPNALMYMFSKKRKKKSRK